MLKKSGKKKKKMLENYNVMFRFCVLLVVLVFVLAILTWNVNLRNKSHVDNECYRTLVHQAVKEAIQAESLQDDIVQSLLNITSAQAKLATASQLVGGAMNLKSLSGGLDVSTIANTMAYHERQLRAIAVDKGLLKQSKLSQYAEERLQIADKKP